MNRRLAFIAGAVLALAAAWPVAAATQISLDASGHVLSFGSSTTGASTCTLDAAGAANLAAAQVTPNGGLTTQATPDSNGNCDGATFTDLPTPMPGPTTHTLSAGSAAGAGATAGLVTGAGSNLQRGAIQWTTGSSPSAGPQVVVTFANAFASPPFVTCFPRTAATAALGLYATNQSASGVTLASANAPATGVTYSCEYEVIP